MKKLPFILTLIILAITATSCLDIYEEVHFNRDGSGTATYRYKMQTSMLNNMMGDEFLSAFDDKDSLKLDEMKRNGISDITVIQDESGFGISFKFDDISALNQGLSAVLGNDKAGSFTDNEMKQFDGSKTKVERITGFLGTDSLKQMLNSKGEDMGLGNMGEMLANSITYHQVYTFDRKIKSVSNKKAVISDNKKTMTLTVPFADMLAGEATLNNTIKLKTWWLW